MTNDIAPVQNGAAIMEQVLIKGDLSKLTPDERNRYYMETCNSLGMNPLTRPFEYITLNGRLQLYARRDAADQLRKINGVNIEILSQEHTGGLYIVHVRATDRGGRQDEDMGAVAMPPNAAGEIKANMILKAITKAKRRVTLSICGLGMLDETEVSDIPASAKASPQARIKTVQSAAAKTLPGPAAADPSAPSHRAEAPADPHGLTPFDVDNGSAGILSPEEQEWDQSLAAHASGGVAVLQEKWANVPPAMKKKLKDRLDKVHKPAAMKADA